MMEASTDPSPEADEPLVMGVPRRELFSVRGFITTPDLAVLGSVADEHWFARASELAADLEAKELQLGVVFRSGDQLLIDEFGILIHASSVPPEATRLGPGLKFLKDLARLSAERLMEADCRGLVLKGYLNDDAFVECRPYFIMVYEAAFPEGVPAPEGMTWVGRRHLRDVALDPVSSIAVDGLVDGP
jgi:hypothetical protein